MVTVKSEQLLDRKDGDRVRRNTYSIICTGPSSVKTSQIEVSLLH
jgi:hypothetical protein